MARRDRSRSLRATFPVAASSSAHRGVVLVIIVVLGSDKRLVRVVCDLDAVAFDPVEFGAEEPEHGPDERKQDAGDALVELAVCHEGFKTLGGGAEVARGVLELRQGCPGGVGWFTPWRGL